jgi:hypothetical protein
VRKNIEPRDMGLRRTVDELEQALLESLRNQEIVRCPSISICTLLHGCATPFLLPDFRAWLPLVPDVWPVAVSSFADGSERLY